jgi:biotin carboxyl carrier protein
MIVTVRVGDRSFDVEVGDLGARPIVATINGRHYHVWPDEAQPGGVLPAQPAAGTAGLAAPASDAPAPRPAQFSDGPVGAAQAGGARCVLAPIPGVVQAVVVRPGDKVVAGQELCVLEAMKMKNLIRASRAGTIAAVHVAAGDHVAHRDPLVEYAE